MDKEIEKHMTLYFSNFYNYFLKWKFLTEDAQPYLTGLKNLAEQLRHVENAKIENEFADFPNVKQLLTLKIAVTIEDELAGLKKLIHSFYDIVQDLKSKLTAFEKTTAFIDWDNQTIVGGNAEHPSLSNLLSLAEDGCTIYHDLYLNILNSFKSCHVQSGKSVINLINSFRIDKDTEEKLNYIIGITQYCY